MRKRRLQSVTWVAGCVLLIAAILGGLTWREMYREKLSHDLIVAIKANDARKVTELLAEGANANAHDDPPGKVSLWQVLMNALRHGTNTPSMAPSALQLALDWRPVADAPQKPTSEDTPLIQALVRHGARQGGREILARMARTYAFCASYEDTGQEISDIDNLSFRTAFVRPYRLFFEYTRSSDDHYVIWENAAGVRSWWTIQPGMQKSTGPLEMALAAATGVSGSTSSLIPGMLVPEQTGGWGGLRRDFADVRVTGTKILDGVPCYEIIPKAATPSPIVVTAIYVDAKSYLLRKLARRITVSSVNLNDDEVILFHPRINVPISESTFHFTPPK